MKTNKTTIKNYNEMLKVAEVIETLCKRVDAKLVNNIAAEKLMKFNDFLTLLCNINSNNLHEKTPKQMRRMIGTWFKHNELAMYQVEIKRDDRWACYAVFNDDLEFAKELAITLGQYEDDARIRNNFTQELSYRAGHNWLTFAK